MFREIRTSERITDRYEERRNEELMRILDKRISEETNKELEEFGRKEASTFDPDKRIVG